MLATAAPASAAHWWGGYHWARTANPFTVKIGDNVGSAWDPSLTTTASDWSLDADPTNPTPTSHEPAQNPANATVTAGNDVGREKQCRATAGRVEACDARYGSNGWLGLASVWVSGSHITQATVKLNDTYYTTAKYNTPIWRAAVTCQEVGHTFGLDHQDTSGANLGTCMDYASNPDAGNMSPNADDYSMLGSIYAGLDSSTTLQSPAGGSGRGLRRVKDDLFVEDLPGGRRFVFVYWAERGNHYNPPADA